MNTRFCLATIAALIALAILVSAWLYPRLPDTIPIHWNLRGEADGFGSKSWAVWVMPATMAGLTLLLYLVLPAVSPRSFQVDSFRDVYNLIIVFVTLFLFVIHLITLRLSLDDQFDASRSILVAFFAFLVLIGNLMGKLRRNLWMGIRVPWTLASERVWIDTHRLAAWIWVAAGLLGALLAWADQTLLALVPLTLAILTPILYSYLHYRDLLRRGELDLDPTA
ncbi:MAG: hypothetical protein KatS3mg108_3206 [Isosphaeraceae bacterium]|jgi:uncharacterized membrane protein|nr:MAG: hypothetical protein KatS3mg108_3206 [Isosphaeraceae bacterium]